MADKQLTEAGWKAFTKSKLAGKDGYKDTALLKALAAFEKAERAGADAQLEALADIDKQAEALRKLYKADKELDGTLDEVVKAVAKERKAAEQAKKAEAAAAAAASSEADDEEDSPALLTSKMVPLIRLVKKGDVVLQALVAVAGKECAVLLSRKSISPARRKLLAEYLGDASGIKYIKGECLLEAKALTFVVASAAGGLAKKLKAALLAQTDLRLKVRVRGEDPDDIDEDGEDEDAADASQGTAQQTSQDTATGDKTGDPNRTEADWHKRLADLQPQLDAALKARHPDATRLRGVSGFAQDKADAGDFAAALKALDMLEKLLAAAPTAGLSAGLAAALAQWRSTSTEVITSLKTLAKEVAESREEESPGAILELNAVIKQLNTEPRTAAQVSELAKWLTEDDVVNDIYELEPDIRAPLATALAGLQRAVA